MDGVKNVDICRYCRCSADDVNLFLQLNVCFRRANLALCASVNEHTPLAQFGLTCGQGF